MITSDIQFPKFPAEIYERIALNDLVTYAVYFLSQIGGEINAEDIVAACFKLFPNRFRLRGYPDWPDSTVVNKRWLDCRDKGLVHGSTAGGFSLTAKGLESAEKTSAILVGKQRLFRKPGLEKVSGEIRTGRGGSSDLLKLQKRFKPFRHKVLLQTSASSTSVTCFFARWKVRRPHC